MKPRGSRSAARLKATLAFSSCEDRALNWPSRACACNASFWSATTASERARLDPRALVDRPADDRAADARPAREQCRGSPPDRTWPSCRLSAATGPRMAGLRVGSKRESKSASARTEETFDSREGERPWALSLRGRSVFTYIRINAYIWDGCQAFRFRTLRPGGAGNERIRQISGESSGCATSAHSPRGRVRSARPRQSAPP